MTQGLRYPNTVLSGDILQELTKDQYPKQGFGGHIQGLSNPAELTLSCTTEKEIENEKMTIHSHGDNDNSGWCDDDVRQDVPPCWLIIEDQAEYTYRKIECVTFRSEPSQHISSVEGQLVNILDFACHLVSVMTQLCHCVQGSHR